VRIGVVLDQVDAPVPGGTGRYALEVAEALVASSPPGGRLSAWTSWRRPGSPEPLGPAVPVHRFPLPRRLLTRAWARGLPPRPWGVDLVHAPTLQAPPRGRVPLVVTIHDAVPWTHPETLTPHGVRWHRTMGERVARSADLVVVPTHAVAEQLSGLLPVARTEVVGEGVTGRLALPLDAADRADRLALPAGGYLVTLATVEPRKGLDVLIAALAEPGAPDLPLLVVGQAGWGGVDPAALAAAAGLPAGRVRLMGRLPDADLAVVLAGATAMVVPSRAEGFGLPVLEGMAAGVPVVTSDDPALVEVGGDAVVSSAIGEAPALAAALAAVTGDAQLRERMVAAGRGRAAAYTWSSAADRLWELYAELVDSSASTRRR
jgi:glycosyltransferase involved in cell wall biosynthesis